MDNIQYFSIDSYPQFITDYEGDPGGEDVIIMADANGSEYVPYDKIDATKQDCGNLSTLFMENCTVFSENINDEQLEVPREFVVRIIIGVALTLIILATIIGNVFVLAAICLERNLHSVANYLILSLAVADLMVACLVMPLGAVYEVSETWMLGEWMCMTWTSSDVLSCTASILHLVAIAMDRYWAVTDIHYIHQRSPTRICTMIGIIWAVSVLVSLSQLGWQDAKWQDNINHHQCVVNQELGYQIFATLSSFYVPLAVILFLYYRIYQAARKRIRRQRLPGIHMLLPRPHAETSFITQTSCSEPSNENAALLNNSNTPVKITNNNLSADSSNTTGTTSTGPPTQQDGKSSVSKVSCSIEADGRTAAATMLLIPTVRPYVPGKNARNTSTKSIKPPKESRESKRERKAAKTLAIVTGAFIMCWLPFFIMALTASSCENCNISKNVMTLILWLGYFNSTLNPIIYTIFSPEFRAAFKKILYGKKHRKRRAVAV